MCWCLPACMYVYLVSVVPAEAEEGVRVTDCCYLPCEFWELNASLLKEPASFFPLLFIIFLSVIWEFHNMNPDHTHFSVLPGSPSKPLQKRMRRKRRRRKKKRRRRRKFNLCCSYSHWSMVKLTVP